MNKIYKTKTIITEQTYQRTENRFLVRPLDQIPPPGKKKIIKIYELVGFLEQRGPFIPSPEQLELCALFTQAFDAFHAGSYSDAKQLFSVIKGKYPQDVPTQIYLERINKLTLGKKG